MGLVRVRCEVCRIGSLWTDDPKGFLDATCPTPGHCQATFFEGAFVSEDEPTAKTAREEPVREASPETAAPRFSEAESHEIRSLLNVILGYDSLLAQRLDEAHRERQVASIRRAVARLEQVLAPALGTPRGVSASSRPRPLDLVRVLRRSVRRVRPVANRRHLVIATRLRETEAVVFLSAAFVSGTLEAMLRKAIDSTGSGEITVSLDRDAGGQLCVEVRSPNATDVDPLAHDPELQALTRGLELEGGRLSAERDGRRGTSMAIHFARGCELRAAPRPAASPPPSRKGRSKKQVVLVVEDDPDTRAFLRAALRRHFDVEFAADAAEARRALAGRPGRIRAVVMDVHLPGEDGLSLTRSIRALPQWKDVPIIAATAYALPEHRAQALAAGCDDYLAKPFPPAELVARIERFRATPH